MKGHSIAAYRPGSLQFANHWDHCINREIRQAAAAPCTFFAQGRCTKGSACPFSHTVAGEAQGEGRAQASASSPAKSNAAAQSHCKVAAIYGMTSAIDPNQGNTDVRDVRQKTAIRVTLYDMGVGGLYSCLAQYVLKRVRGCLKNL